MSRVDTGLVFAASVESSSRPGVFYAVTKNADGRWACECPHFRHRETECRHIRGMREALARERVRMRKVREVFLRFTDHEVQERLYELDQILGDGE